MVKVTKEQIPYHKTKKQETALETQKPERETMTILREKITLALTALAWVVFHVRTGPDWSAVITGTIIQLLSTAPYALGCTIILVCLLRFFTGGVTPPWDRILRIFFTIAIFFAFFFALYEYGYQAEKIRLQEEADSTTLSRSLPDETPKVK